MSNVSSAQLQKAYISLYKTLRDYIWDFRVVDTLTDLEVATYQKFPDVKQVQHQLQLLEHQVRGTDAMDNNKAMQKAFNQFYDLLNNPTMYASLDSFKGVIQ